MKERQQGSTAETILLADSGHCGSDASDKRTLSKGGAYMHPGHPDKR